MRKTLLHLSLVFLAFVALALCLTPVLVAQETTGGIRGKVDDASTGDALIGANVILQGTNRGASTNAEGVFEMKAVSPGRYMIVARFLGYTSSQQNVEVTTGKISEVNFSLQQDVLKTDEVVVTGLSGDIPRSQLGNSIAKISGADIAKLPVTSVQDGLMGKAPGVQITKSTGTPGTGTYMVIRGRRTITGSSQPLLVVDGVPLDDSFIYDGSGTKQGANRGSDIDPNDVESMEILKGASAAAIYGSRAGNGVVLITTKSGKQAEPGKFARIHYSSSVSWDEIAGSVPLQTTFGQRIPYTPGSPGSGSTDSYGAALAPGTPTYAHDKDIFRTGHLGEHTLSVSGGSQMFKYLVSGTFTQQTGVAIKSDYTRENLRLNLNYMPFSNLSIRSNSNYINSLTNLPQDGSNTSGILLGSLRTPPEFDNNKFLEDDGVRQRRFASYDNPRWTMEFNTYKTELTRFIHSTGFDYDVLEGLRFSGNVGWDRYNQFTGERLFNDAAATANRLGAINQNRYTNDVVNTDLSATGKYQFSEDFLGTLILGQQLSFFVRNTTSGSSTNTLPFYGEIGAGISKNAGSSRSESRIYSYYVQGMLNAWDKLTVTGAVRRDAGSTFGTAGIVYYYPKASVAYRLSQESFMKDLKGIIDEFKIRGAWGRAGRTPDTYATNTTYTTAGFFDPWGRGTSAGKSNQLGIRHNTGQGNQAIKPEINTEIEVGFDMALLDRRISAEFSYYKQDITQLLLFVNVPTSTGYNSQFRNAGEMWNKGFEVKLDFNPIRMDDFSWILGLNYAQNKNEVTKLEGFSNSYVTLQGAFVGNYNIAKEGKPLGTWLGSGYLRDANNNIVYSDPNDATRYDNVTSRYIKNAPLFSSVPVELGKTDPDWTGAIRNDFTFFNGDLTASVLVQAAFGFKVWNGTRGAMYNFGTHKDTEDRKDPWFNQNGDPVIWVGNGPTDTLRLYSGALKFAPGQQLTKEVYYRTYGNGFNINEPHVVDGSYVKLRDVTVAYRWRKVPFFNIESIVFTFSARNLKTWTDYDGYDPEVNTFAQAEGRGMDYFTLPQIRSFRFDIGINY